MILKSPMCPSDTKKSPKSNQEEQSGSSQLLQGYVIHYDTGARTSEGLGSHARASLFPLIHIAATLGLQPLFCNDGLKENTARDYSQLDVASFLGLQEEQGATRNNNDNNNSINALKSTCSTVLNFSTWTDSTIGSACGDPVLLGELLKDYLYSTSNKNRYYDHNQETQPPPTAGNVKERRILLCLTGSFRYMNPTRPVLDYLKNQSLQWRKSSSCSPCPCCGQPTNDNDIDNNVDDDKIQIVAHVRVPEDFCPQFWKDCNSIDKVLNVLDLMEASLCRILLGGGRIHHHDDKAAASSAAPAFLLAAYADITIVTEQAFSIQDEKLVLNRFPTTRIHRGTPETLLQDLQQLATSDVLIPSSSHLSAFAGYLTHGVIFLSDPSRLEYFQPHVDLQKKQQACSSVIFAANDNPKFHDEMQKLFHFRSCKQQQQQGAISSSPPSDADLPNLDGDGSSKEGTRSDSRRRISSCS